MKRLLTYNTSENHLLKIVVYTLSADVVVAVLCFHFAVQCGSCQNLQVIMVYSHSMGLLHDNEAVLESLLVWRGNLHQVTIHTFILTTAPTLGGQCAAAHRQTHY